ncbi:hypothetical protein evm_013611 [Chilo suppressalis]|nr:hypothetical protein evm_013611 [Chilo suppressalis]
MDIDQGIEHSQLSMPSTSTSGVLTEKLELQQNAVKKSKILTSAMDQSVTNLKKVVKKLTEKNLKYTTRLKKFYIESNPKLKWIKLPSLSSLESSSPKIPSDWSEDAQNLIEKNSRRLQLLQLLDSALWVSLDFS